MAELLCGCCAAGGCRTGCPSVAGCFSRDLLRISGRVGIIKGRAGFPLEPTEQLSIFSAQKALRPISALEGNILASPLPQKWLISHEV